MATLTCGGVALPEPTELSVGNEMIWSSSTGRSASGYMIGDVIAQKYNLNVRWELLTKAELDILRNTLVAGFFPLTFTFGGETITLEAYRGTLSYELMPDVGDGAGWVRSASVTIIQR